MPPLLCRCGRPATQGACSVYGFLYASCGPCGLYTSADTPEQLAERWQRRIAWGLGDVMPDDPCWYED